MNLHKIEPKKLLELKENKILQWISGEIGNFGLDQGIWKWNVVKKKKKTGSHFGLDTLCVVI